MDSIPALLLTIVVRVYPVTPADLALVASARPVATRVLADAGVELIWITCSSRLDAPCPSPGSGDVLVRFQGNLPEDEHCCGTARSTGRAPAGLVTLFGKCVDRASDRVCIPRATIAGYTLAHEIGHLLLRRGHTPHGLMAAGLDCRRALADVLRFTPEEVEAIRGILTAPEITTPAASPVR